MCSHKMLISLFACALSLGIANAEVIENIKASEEAAKKFKTVPKVIEVDGEKVFTAPPKSYSTYYLEKIKVDPAKKYRVSVKLKQSGDKPALVYIGFIPYDAKGRIIFPWYVNSIKGSATVLAADAAKGAKSITVKDAAAWKKGKYDFVAFNTKDDMSDMPNRETEKISKIEKTGDVYTISLRKPLGKAYSAGTKVRQHRSSATYIYTKFGDSPKEWIVWTGRDVYGENSLRKATYISPMIMINAKKEGAGVVFTDFICEEFSVKAEK